MTQPAKVPEPSMEEILASIRRIIADDEAKPPAGPAKAAGDAVSAKAPLHADRPAPALHAPPKVSSPGRPHSNSQNDVDSLLAELDEAPNSRPSASDAEVLELTDDMALPTDSFNKIDPEDDLEINEGAHHRANPAPAPAAATPTSGDPAPPSAQQMLSRSTVSAVESAFNTLAHTVLSNNARTLEDLVREMLRPMLKSWLDDNLPNLVERIVKAEIERVSRGR
jgi:cell pole-organizing protein PopZ